MGEAATLPDYEAPSGKGAGDENFPVGSFLLPARLRPHIVAFYAFARAIDDVADNPALAPDEKIRRLDGFEQALLGRLDAPGLAKAATLRESLLATGITTQHGVDLISAFKQDAVKGRYQNWDELIDYCNRSAAPVGRYLLDLHGESKDHYRYSDALCNALQVINHLQDCGDDYANIDRVYLPQDWIAAAGTATEALAAGALDGGLRKVLDRCLAGTQVLMADAEKLPRVLASPRLAVESGAIVALAREIAARLARQDPLATRVALSKPAFALYALRGVVETFVKRTARAR